MKVAIVGAGGVGGYFGGLLARAGHDVTFVARGGHLDAIRRNGGLQVVSQNDGDFHAPGRGVETPPMLASKTWRCSTSRCTTTRLPSPRCRRWWGLALSCLPFRTA